METVKEFKIAGISTGRRENGILEIDTTAHRMTEKYLNVVVTISEDKSSVSVTGEKVEIGISMSDAGFDINKITEDSIETYKPWPWSKPKQRSKTIVEFKERKKYTFKSNNYLIIE